MTSSRRYVFDTNTLISAALFEGGNPGTAFRHALKSGTVLLSQATFEEIDEVLAREKFDDYLIPSAPNRCTGSERSVRSANRS
jgi:predicted nucleic acid-binding protein